MGEVHDKLMELSKGNVSNWKKEAEYRLNNRKWLRYSGRIACRVLAAMEDTEGMTEELLATKIGKSPKYIDKLLKGHQNLTLKTISKLSEALQVELISFPEYKYSQPL